MPFTSKAAAFGGLESLRDLVSDSMAIDMGSSATVIYVRGRGIVVDEPSLVAVNTINGNVVAIGKEAQQMYGREARDVTVVAPLLNGVVADFERTRQMLAHFVHLARSGVSHFSRRALMSVMPGITQVELRALFDAAKRASIGRVCMIEGGVAAALGAGVNISEGRASAIVDIGGATTNVSIVANGSIVHARTHPLGGWSINEAIMNHVRRHRGLEVGTQTAERLKIELGSATPPTDLAQEIQINGRDVLTGSPAAIEISAGEIYPVVHELTRKIEEIISTALTEVPAEVAGDIYARGIILTGGGALLNGLDDYLSERTKLTVRVADEPRYAMVRGLEQMFNEPLSLRRVMRWGPKQRMDMDRDLLLISET
jgi:rod shape-determining protein MreB and related proteins